VLLYHAARILFRIIALPLFRFSVDGVGRVPRVGPAVLVAPHRSWLDPACVGGACPRPVRFLIMDSIYRKPWARWFYRSMRSIPVRLGDGPNTVAAVRDALRVLGQGDLLGIFPEGRVVARGSSGTVHPGAALLAIRAGVPVIPLAIDGSAAAWPHGRLWPGPAKVRVRFGQPLEPPSRETGRPGVERFAERIGEAIVELAGERGSGR
jgi:1-acyl-sn-glycerol-3-phosphate acyltransferase